MIMGLSVKIRFLCYIYVYVYNYDYDFKNLKIYIIHRQINNLYWYVYIKQ